MENNQFKLNQGIIQVNFLKAHFTEIPIYYKEEGTKCKTFYFSSQNILHLVSKIFRRNNYRQQFDVITLKMGFDHGKKIN